jgi:protein-serine/threonine kinase
MDKPSRSPAAYSFPNSAARQAMQAPQAPQNNTLSNKPPDYVYFDRTTAGFSDDAVPRAKGAQLKLEHYYKIAVDAAIERNTRLVLNAVRMWYEIDMRLT